MVSDFSEEWSGCEQRLRATLLRQLRDEHLADEVLQETALRCFRGFATFQRRSSFITWALRISQNEIARWHTRRRPTESLESDPADHRTDPVASTESTASGKLDGSIQEAAREGFVPPEQAQVLQLRLEQPGADWSAIGGQLNLSANHCATLHVRGVKALRVFLFARRPAQLGGMTAIALAFQTAGTRRVNPLDSAESNAFRLALLERTTDPLARGTFSLLREACTKVIKELSPL